MRVRPLPLVLLLAVVASACRGQVASEAPASRVVVFQDGSQPDARSVVSPGVLGMQAGLEGVLRVEVLEIGGSEPSAVAAQAKSAASDPSVVAAVIAPFTVLPDGAVSALRSGGVPVLSLSSSVPAPQGPGAPWRSFVASVPAEAARIAAGADALLPAGTAFCLAGADEGGWSASFARALSRRVGRLEPPGPSRAVTLVGSPSEVAAAVDRARGCGVLVWSGTTDGAVALWRDLAATPHRPVLLLADRARTPGFLEAIGPVQASARLEGSCACADVSAGGPASADRFLHEYQAATGLDPGPFAVEGWDLGRFVAGIAGKSGRPSRDEVATGVAAASRAPGVGGPYRWDRSGALTVPSARWYRAVGWRWLSPIVAPWMGRGGPALSAGGRS
ncbi:MAG: ABC transporter substrate-binding protein [Actinomycetota bacterium]